MRVPKAADLISETLRRRIISGEATSDIAREAELIEEFGVSRPTLREAVRILEAEGLVRITRGPHGGIEWRPPDAQVAARYAAMVLRYQGATVGDVYEARAAIEPIAARLCAERATPDDVLLLREIVEREFATASDPVSVAYLGASFHQALVRLGRNQTLALISDVITQVISAHSSSTVSLDHTVLRVEDTACGLQDHVDVIDAVEQGDGARAEGLWRGHVRRVAARLASSHRDRRLVEFLD